MAKRSFLKNIPVPIYLTDNYEYYSNIIIVKIRLSLGISGFSLIFFLPQSFKTFTWTYFFLKILMYLRHNKFKYSYKKKRYCIKIYYTYNIQIVRKIWLFILKV